MKLKTVFLFALFAIASVSVQSQVAEKQSVLATARAHINDFVKDIPAENLPDYGFSGKNELDKITFGDPVAVYTLKDSAVIFTDTWRVPVVIGGQYRSLLTVSRSNGSFSAVDFGAVELAKSFQANKTPQTIGMLRVYEIRTDYLIEGSANGSQMFIKLEFNR